jgi:two-component system sensor kinase FixL
MKHTQTPARQSTARLDAILEAAVDGIIAIDADGKVQTYNKACERLFGYAAGEVIGQNVKMLMPSPDRERHDDYLDNYKRTGVRKIIGIGREVIGKRKDGTTFPMDLAVAEVREGGERAFVGIIRDISERKRAETQLRELQAQLLHVSRLNDMGAMATAFAHELNQPLGAALNYLNAVKRWLAQGPVAPPGRMLEGTERAVAEIARAGQIIQRLRQFVSKSRTERSPEKLGKLIQEAIALALTGMAHMPVKIDMSLPADLPEPYIDRVQVQQVLTNLLRNAIEAMAETARREIEIGARVVDGMIEVAVKDTGPGLMPEVAKNLFKPFVTTKAAGMGVGLSICRSIVLSHGGELRAEPNPSGGTIFRFTLPLTGSEAARDG